MPTPHQFDGTFRLPRPAAATHAARLLPGGWLQTLCNSRKYLRDLNFQAGSRGITCQRCAVMVLPPRPFSAGSWTGPTVYCTRGDLLTMGLLKQINTLLEPLALFAELQADGTLRILNYRDLPAQAAACAEVVRQTKRPPPV